MQARIAIPPLQMIHKRASSLVVNDLRSETKGSQFDSGC